MNYEMRCYNAEIRSVENGNLSVSGYVNITGSQSRVLGGNEQKFVETIAKGAFSKALANATRDIDFLAEHNTKLILASTRNGSLSLKEDSKGLFMSAEITATSWGTDYFKLIDSGILKNMSFGFRTIKDDWRVGKDGIYQRTVYELELIEVSVVREPAYLDSSISSRSEELTEENIPLKVQKEKKQMDEFKEFVGVLSEGIRSFNERLATIEGLLQPKETEKRNDEAVESEVVKPEEEVVPEEKPADKEPKEQPVEKPVVEEKPAEEKVEPKPEAEDEKRAFIESQLKEIRDSFNTLKG